MDARRRGDRVRRRGASALRPGPLRTLPAGHPAQADDEGARIVQGHDRAAAPGPGDGDRRPPPGAGRADPRPGHPLSQAVLPAPAGGLLRRGQDHPHHHPPGRGSRAHPDRRDVHPRWQGHARQPHGRAGRALRRAVRHGGQRRGGTRTQAARRAFPALRQDRDAVRRRPARAARRPRRDQDPRPRRPVRRHHERNLRMNAADSTMPAAPRTVATPHPTHKFRLLLRREFWEHKGGFLWAPLVAGGISLLLTVMAILIGEVAARQALADGEFDGEIMVNGLDLGYLSDKLGPQELAELSKGIDLSLYMASGWPLLVLGFVVFFYCLGALYDDRKDRSVLFWKSLPISDRDTVLSKAASALVVAPLIAIAASLATMVGFMIVASIVVLFHGGNPITLLWGPGNPLAIVASYAANLPVYALWALPTVGWLLMCSAWARSQPFLW